MKAPEFMTPEDGWDQLTLPAPFGDERKELDIFCRQKADATVYEIYIDGLEMGELVYTGQWLALRGNLLTAKEISILTPIIMESTVRPPEPSVMTDDEKRLREWMTGNEVYPGEPEMQAMVIISFHAEETDEYDDDNLIPLDEIDFDKFDLNSSFVQESKSDENDEQEWQGKVRYALDNLDNFLLYINAEWR